MGRAVRIAVFIFMSIGLSLFLGCAARQVTQDAESPGDIGGEIAGTERTEPEGEETQVTMPPGAEDIYDIEEEMPVERDIEERDRMEEDLPFAGRDSILVEDVTRSSSETEKYTVGYRVQVFASKELEKAKKVKSEMSDQTSLGVYIEFEDGMYKVRAGDFGSREEAAEARKRLTRMYPDCWIAETTIKSGPR